MHISLSAIEKGEMERLILVTTLGLLESLESRVLTIDECQGYLFSPYTKSILDSKEVDKAIIAIIEKTLYLEDYESLLPDDLAEYIEHLKRDILDLIKTREAPVDINEAKQWLDE
ncbi:DUF3969 family protein [Enterococcus plantarum]|uniref:DUF3969 family protein n=1 Tax=Enterococcus plantarum TaxID=1077675 RepID=UPI001A8FAA2E|nr:DUF3969 family protein [Enterococcus plantarum]MBO0421446.1 DUF3969 family protein [Enterococcus plantarum]